MGLGARGSAGRRSPRRSPALAAAPSRQSVSSSARRSPSSPSRLAAGGGLPGARRRSRSPAHPCRRAPRRATSGDRSAGNATRRPASAGGDRTTISPCTPARARPCSATSTARDSRTPASPRRSSGETAKFFVRTDGPDGTLADYRDQVHVRRRPAAAVSDRVSRRPAPGARHRLGRAPAERGRPALVPSLPRREDRLTATSSTGPARSRTGTTCAPTATRPNVRKNYDAAGDRYATHVVRDQRGVRGVPRPRLAPRGVGRAGRRGRARDATQGPRVALDDAAAVTWTIEPATRQRAAQRRRATTRARSSVRAAATRGAARSPRTTSPAGRSSTLPCRAARRAPLLRRRPDPRRGLRVRLVPRRAGCTRAASTCSDCHDPHSQQAPRARQPGLRAAATRRRTYDDAGAPLPRGGHARAPLRRAATCRTTTTWSSTRATTTASACRGRTCR